MKQKIINGIVITVIVVVMAALIFPWPKDFNKEFNGIKYQIGQDNQNYLKEVKVTFIGEFKESYFGLIEDRFVGNIYIDGVDIYKNKGFELGFDEERTTVIAHRCFIPTELKMKVLSYGKLYLSEELDALVIELYDDYNNPAFNKLDGYVIVAPAYNRGDAVEIVDELVKH